MWRSRLASVTVASGLHAALFWGIRVERPSPVESSGPRAVVVRRVPEPPVCVEGAGDGEGSQEGCEVLAGVPLRTELTKVVPEVGERVARPAEGPRAAAPGVIDERRVVTDVRPPPAVPPPLAKADTIVAANVPTPPRLPAPVAEEEKPEEPERPDVPIERRYAVADEANGLVVEGVVAEGVADHFVAQARRTRVEEAKTGRMAALAASDPRRAGGQPVDSPQVDPEVKPPTPPTPPTPPPPATPPTPPTPQEPATPRAPPAPPTPAETADDAEQLAVRATAAGAQGGGPFTRSGELADRFRAVRWRTEPRPDASGAAPAVAQVALRRSVRRPLPPLVPAEPEPPTELVEVEVPRPPQDPVETLREAIERSRPRGSIPTPELMATATSGSGQVTDDVERSDVAEVSVRETPAGVWTADVIALVHARWYATEIPIEDRIAGISGEVTVRFEVLRTGQVRNVAVESGSGFARLDGMAVASVPGRVPPPPPEAGAPFVQRVTFRTVR